MDDALRMDDDVDAVGVVGRLGPGSGSSDSCSGSEQGGGHFRGHEGSLLDLLALGLADGDLDHLLGLVLDADSSSSVELDHERRKSLVLVDGDDDGEKYSSEDRPQADGSQPIVVVLDRKRRRCHCKFCFV